jgi:hypothetical protein
MTQGFACSIRIGSPDDLLSTFFADPLCQSVPDRAQVPGRALAQGECHVATESERIVGFVIRNGGFFGQAFVPLIVVAVASRRAGPDSLVTADLPGAHVLMAGSADRAPGPSIVRPHKLPVRRIHAVLEGTLDRTSLLPGDKETVAGRIAKRRIRRPAV